MTADLFLEVGHEVAPGRTVRIHIDVDLDQLDPTVRRWVHQIITAATVPFPDVAPDPGRAEAEASPPAPAVEEATLDDPGPALPDPSEVAAPAPPDDVVTSVRPDLELIETQPEPSAAPTPADETSVRGRVLVALEDADGEFVDPAGSATRLLLDAAGLTCAQTYLNTALRDLEHQKLITRNTQGRRTYRIALVNQTPTPTPTTALKPAPTPPPAEDRSGPHPGGDRLDMSCFHGDHEACHRRRRPCSCPCHPLKDQAA